MSKSSRKQIFLILFAIALAIALGYFLPVVSSKTYAQESLPQDTGSEETLKKKKVLGLLESPHTVTKIYYRNRLIGVLYDQNELKKTMDQVYQEKYAEKFPDTSLGLGEDVYTISQQSYYDYENVDEELVSYLDENNLFSIMTNKITFSNGAVIYVKDLDMFTSVREHFLLNFIDEETYRTLQSHQSVSPLNEYGEQSIDLKVRETMSVSEGLAPEDKIFTTEEEIITFFSYGYDTIEKEYYTTVDGDTVAGVVTRAGKNLSSDMLITLNPDVLISADQLLSPGTKLNVTYFQSPINVEVTKERLAQENVYPEATKYIYDDTMDTGTQVVEVEQVIGKKNVRYHDTYVNGVLEDGEIVSEVVTTQPVQRVVRVGTRAVSNEAVIDYASGTGVLWPPVKNPSVSCGYGCYYGHNGTDFQNRYDLWGLVYAADSGTVYMNSYSPLNGYYMIIMHGNGMSTYYGHMRTPGFFNKGDTVQQGQAIGNIGMTGLASGPHVHFMVALNGPVFFGGTIVNPCGYVAC